MAYRSSLPTGAIGALSAGLPHRTQVAALCMRKKAGERQVLLITSRGTGRWVLPKGWPMKGLSNAKAAAQEAWEEAGVKRAKLTRRAIGRFTYDKQLDTGGHIPVRAEVFALKVKKLSKTFPESHERRRKWVSPAKAAQMVQEPELKALLLSLDAN